MKWIIETEDKPRQMSPGEMGIDSMGLIFKYPLNSRYDTFSKYYVITSGQSPKLVEEKEERKEK